MALSNTVLVTEVQDMAVTPDGFAQRLRPLRKQQTELVHLAELHYTHIGSFERDASQDSGQEAARRLPDHEAASGLGPLRPEGMT